MRTTVLRLTSLIALLVAVTVCPAGGPASSRDQTQGQVRCVMMSVGQTMVFTYEGFPQFLDFAKPRVTNPARALIFQHVEFGGLPKLQPFDLLIAAGFDEEVPEFKFGSLRLQ